MFMKRISRELARGAFVLALAALLAAARGHAAPAGAMTDAEKKEQYVQAVVRGAGYLPWQARGLSREELEFRRRMEERKTQLLAGRRPLKHPVMVDAQARRRALRNIEAAGWARQMAAAARRRADYIVAQPDGYVEAMIGKQTPWYDYGMTCPNCVGRKSQEGTGHGLLKWDYKNPDTLTCTVCGAIYPSAKYPETQKLLCPRTGQSFSFFLNPKEQAHPDDRSGDLAYKWVGHPMHMSFSGTIGKSKIDFMIGSLDDLALTYFITQDPRYARRAQQIMTRLAVCYRGWLYHDYWNTVADADPLYAAWHDADMPLEWKRHLCTSAFKRDSLGKAAMLRDFWGGGRLHPSTDNISVLSSVGRPTTWSPTRRAPTASRFGGRPDRARVERDLLLEWVFTAEPYDGGPDRPKLNNNKSPRVYLAFGLAARALCLPRTGRHGAARL